MCRYVLYRYLCRHVPADRGPGEEIQPEKTRTPAQRLHSGDLRIFRLLEIDKVHQ